MSNLPFSWHVYLPVDESAIAAGLYVTGLGRARTQAGSNYPQAEHPGPYELPWARGRVLSEYAVVLVGEGEGEFESEQTALRMFNAPALLFLTPGDWHRYRPLSETGWTEHWVCFSGELAPRLAEFIPADAKYAPQSVREFDQLTTRFDRMVNRAREANVDCGSVLVPDLLETLGIAFASIAVERGSEKGTSVATSEPAATTEATVAAARAIVWTRSHRRLSVAEVARQLNLSRRTLERRFADSGSGTVLEEIQSCRLSRARRLLAETRLSVKEIAYMAGFPTPERMRVAFQGGIGISPGEFRRRSSSESR